MRLLVNQLDCMKRESKYTQFKQESEHNPIKEDELRQRQEPTETYEKDKYVAVRTENAEIQNEIFMKNCQEEKLDENSVVENRLLILDEGYRNILKETVSLKEMIENITDITNELKNKKHFVNLTNYQEMFLQQNPMKPK